MFLEAVATIFWLLLDGFWYDRTEVNRRNAWKKCGQSDSIAAVLFCFMSIFMVLCCVREFEQWWYFHSPSTSCNSFPFFAFTVRHKWAEFTNSFTLDSKCDFLLFVWSFVDLCHASCATCGVICHLNSNEKCHASCICQLDEFENKL